MSTAAATDLASTGIAGLDDILGGGLPRGYLYVLNGGSGSGKTTLALQFLLAGDRANERALHVTMSESPAELEETLRSHGWSRGQLAIYQPPTVTRDPISARQTMFPPAEVELEEIVQPLLAEVERVQPTRLVIDSISEIHLLARDPLRFRREILALKRAFYERGCTVLLIGGNATGTEITLLQTLAHGVLVLNRTISAYGVPRTRLAIDKLRASVFRAGFHDYRIRTGGLEVYPRLVAAEHAAEHLKQPVKSSISELDSLLGGGLDLGTSTLLLGPSGTGKTTLATLFAASCADRGLDVALYLFAERRDTLIQRSAALGMDLGPHLRSGRVSIAELDPAEVSPGELSQRVRDAVQTRNARMVVIDSLNGFFQAMPEEPYPSLHLHELLTYLNHKGVATILSLAQRGLVGTLAHVPVDVSYLADAVVLLRFFEARGHVRQAVSMLKKRTGAHERAIRELSITAAGVRVGRSLDEFQGVLTGVPEYHGPMAPLLRDQDDDTGQADGSEQDR